MAPSMEVTDHNLKALFERVQTDLAKGERLRDRHGDTREAADIKAPKGPKGEKEYWAAGAAKTGRWIKKLPKDLEGTDLRDTEGGEGDGGAKSSRASTRRFRTLVRRVTGEDPHRRGFRGLGVTGAAVPQGSRGAEDDEEEAFLREED